MAFEEAPIWEVVKDLRRIKLSPNDRAFIVDADTRGATSLSQEDKGRVRVIAKRHQAQLEEMQAARERARQSLALSKMGSSLQTHAEQQAKKVKVPRRDPRGFGF